jgi:DNA-binding beta-propeller fold protein YncE
MLSNSVVAMDIATNTVIPAPGLVGTFSGPVAIAFTPNSRYGYVSNATNGTVNIFDTLTNTVVGIIPGFNKPQVLAITPDGQYAYVPNVGNNTVSVIYIGVQPPLGFSGCKTRNTFLLETDNVNLLTWSTPAGGNTPVSYAIYRDPALTQLVAIVPASQMCYYDHDRCPNVDYTYYIVAVDGIGNTSSPAATIVTQSC